MNVPVNSAPPAGGAPPSSAPASQAQVPVDVNQTTVPNPVGQQAPEKPPGQDDGKASALSRRESIQAAFDRANKMQESGDKTPRRAPEREAPPPREARRGDNNPPEETPPERAESKPGDRYREGGRFARRPEGQQQPPQGQQGAPGGQQAPRRYDPLPDHAPYREPLGRFRDGAKAEWAGTPESVRGEVYRMAQDFVGAYNKYTADMQAMEPIRRFHKMAQDHGTTLEQALTRYVSMEEKLRSDPIAGLDTIVHNLNLQTSDGQRLGLRDIAYHILTQTPDQLRQIQQGNQQTAANHQIGALHKQIQGLQNVVQQMQTTQQFTYTRSAVDQFADDGRHPRFDELGDLINVELQHGYDLETAYRRAELLRPATQAPQTRTPAAQTRNADRSIHGAPDGASPPDTRAARRANGAETPSRREAIRRAIQRAGNGL